MKKWKRPVLHHLNYCQTSYSIETYSYKHRFICDCCGETYPERDTLEQAQADEQEHLSVCSRIFCKS